MTATARARRPGFTLIEVLVGITVLALALLGLSATASTNLRTGGRSREEVQYWADAQRVIDSLMARGFGNVSSGSITLRGRAISWTAGSAASAPQQLTIVVQRPTYQNVTVSASDTITMFLARTAPGP